jgi:CBS domain-containing protein
MRVPLRVDVDRQPVGVQRCPGRLAGVALPDRAAFIYPRPLRLVARRPQRPSEGGEGVDGKRIDAVVQLTKQGFAFVFGFIGLVNPSWFMLIFVALFVYIGASQEAALAQMKDVSRRFPVSSAMVREFRTLAADATLEEAVDALLATSQHDFPVMDEAGNVAGLLTRHDLISALRKNDPTLRVGDVMRRDIPTVTTGTRFEDAFRIMQECDCPAVPVLDRMKRLVGLLTPENVTELMMVQSAMPQRRVL